MYQLMTAENQDLAAQARELIASQEYHEAVRICRRVLLSRPNDVQVRLLLGQALLPLERYEEVRVQMLSLARRTPDDPAVHRLLGEAYLRSGQEDKAWESLTAALQLDPQDEEAAELLGEVAGEPASNTLARWFDPDAVATEEVDFERTTDEMDTDESLDLGGATEPIPPVDLDEEDTAANVPSIKDVPPELSAPLSSPPSPPPSRSTAPSAHALGAVAPLSSAPLSHTPLASERSPDRETKRSELGRVVGLGRQAYEARSGAREGQFPAVEGTSELDLAEIEEIEQSESSVSYSVLNPAPEIDPMDEVPTVARPPSMMSTAKGGSPAGRITAAAASIPVRPTPLADPTPLEEIPTNTDIEPEELEEVEPLEIRPTRITSAGSPLFPPSSAEPVAAAPDQAERRTASLFRMNRVGASTWLFGGVVLLLVVAIAFGLRFWLGAREERALAQAAQKAADDGLASSLDEALGLDKAQSSNEPSQMARRARLMAMGVFEHGRGYGAEARALTASLSGIEPVPTDLSVADIYLGLASGELGRVRRGISGVQTVRADDPNVAEAAYARALWARRVGDHARALAEAKAAVTRRPESVRYVALLARETAAMGDRKAALSTLDGMRVGVGLPALRIARARILLPERPLARAQKEATVVAGSSQASRPQRSEAHAILARLAVSAGDTTQAREYAMRAEEDRPPGDEVLGLELISILLDAHAPQQARTILRGLPRDRARPEYGAAVAARVHLAVGDLGALKRVLSAARETPAISYLRGRYEEERGRVEAARAQYRKAALDPSHVVAARARLGALELRAGQPRQAVELLKAIPRAPGQTEVVLLLIQAYLAANLPNEALVEARRALRDQPDSAPLLMAKADIDLARGENQAALAVLSKLAQSAPDDPDLHAKLAETARRCGDRTRARTAFDRALALRSDHPVALAGLIHLAVDEANVGHAREMFERAKRAKVQGPDFDLAAARLFVVEGAGDQAVSSLREMTRRRPNAGLWAALGQAYVHAERHGPARRAFEQAIELDASNVDALLGMAQVFTRIGELSRASRSIGSAERIVNARSLGSTYQARILSARSRLHFEYGRFDEAAEKAKAAIQLDGRNAQAHLLLALIAVESSENPVPHLRSALAGRACPPEAVALLAQRLPRNGGEACALARRYLTAAPQGLDARAMKPLAGLCS